MEKGDILKNIYTGTFKNKIDKKVLDHIEDVQYISKKKTATYYTSQSS